MRKTGTTTTWMSSPSPDQKSEHVLSAFWVSLSLSPFYVRTFVSFYLLYFYQAGWRSNGHLFSFSVSAQGGDRIRSKSWQFMSEYLERTIDKAFGMVFLRATLQI